MFVDADKVTPRVNDAHVLVRRMAVKALAALGDTNEVSAIEAALTDSESSVRMAATASLATLNGPQSVNAIFSSLEQDDYFQFKNACVDTLSIIAGVSDVNSRMNSGSQAIREVGARTLYSLGKNPAYTDDVYTILRNRMIDVDEANEVRYWAIYGQTALRTWFDTTQRNQLISDLMTIANSNEPAIVQLKAIGDLAYMKSDMSPTQITDAVNDLIELFATYGDSCTRNDAAYGWRVIGNTLIVLGAEGTNALAEIMDPQVNSVTATASSEYASHPASLCVNKSGLDYGKHTWNHTEMWLSINQAAHWLKFEFDTTYKLEKMQLWNYNQAPPYNNRGIRHATIEYSTNGTSWTTLDSDYEFSKAPGFNGYEHADDVWFNGVPAKYVKITPHAVNGNWGYDQQVGVSEVIFNVDPADPNYPTDSWLPWLAYQVLYEKQQTHTQNGEGFNLVTEANDVRDHGRYSPSDFPGYRSW